MLPCFVEAVRMENERQVVMGVLETMNNVMKSCKEEVFKDPSRLKEISNVIRDVLKQAVRRVNDDDDDGGDGFIWSTLHNQKITS